MTKFVYADNAATTPVSREVVEAMSTCFETAWGNPSSMHSKGIEAERLLIDARARIAATLGCKPGEIYFTSCGTESDNWAIKGAAYASKKRRKIVTSKIEHHAVLHTCEYLEKNGYEVTYLDVDENGLVSITDLLHEIKSTTTIVSIMAVNNEVGTIQNLKWHHVYIMGLIINLILLLY